MYYAVPFIYMIDRYSVSGGYEVITGCELVREINTEMVESFWNYFKENPYVEV